MYQNDPSFELDPTEIRSPAEPKETGQTQPYFIITIPPGGGSYTLNSDGTLTLNS